MDAHRVTLVSVRQKALALAVTDEVGLQPAGQTMFAGGLNEAIWRSAETLGRQGATLGFAKVGFEDRPETELCEQRPDREYGTSSGGIEDLRV